MVIILYGLAIGFVIALIGYMKNRSTRNLFYDSTLGSDAIKYSIVAVIAAKNEERVIETTVRSLLSRSPKTFRAIVVDDNSTDSTYEILTELAKEYPNLVVQRNFDTPGKSGALNVALDMIKEDIVLFLDADARVDWDFVRKYSKLFDSPDINVVFADFESYNQSRTLAVILQDLYFSFIKAFVYSGLFSPTIFMNSGVFIRRQILDAVGKFDTQTLVDDFDLALRLMKNKIKVKFIMGEKCKIQYALSLKDLFYQHCRWYTGGIKKIAKQISQGRYLGILVFIAIGALTLFPVLMFILAYLLSAEYLLSVVLPFFLSILFSSTVTSYILHDGHRRKEMLINIILGAPLAYFLFQIAIIFSLIHAFGKKSVWHKVIREKT
ncbi:hypothetical protein IX53_09535 [Kosmotoga pacifica]|uniref:Glycosyltransferase 2-like domain-containing protein n=1 Tax=Kosmotoga pacifica TaxID=1330330 RepID=A0A0G2Z8Z2_9BACT|nr:hypothetical protein IX53_09535 [Kosmotoga pacifica]